MFDTNFVFTPGKLTTILDGQAGSSGKGKIGSFICAHASNWTFACNTFSPQAGHWVRLDDGREFFYQTLNSCAYQIDRYQKLYIGPGAIIELPALLREIRENGVPDYKLGISPLTAILQDIDGCFERGTHDFDGQPRQQAAGGYLAKTGTTAHGAGACRARRVLRRPEAKYARDTPELQKYLCDVPGEIIARLNRGEAGLLEVAQGFQLSYLLPQFFPFTTSRNCSVAAGLDDMMLPPYYAGNTVINLRTYPIRINSNKYVDKATGRHLTWDEVRLKAPALFDTSKLPTAAVGTQPTMNPREIADKPNKLYLDQCGITLVEGSSGPGYPDQREISWQDLTEAAGSPDPIMEMTSVTKLPRRVFTFSRQNVNDAIRHNRGNGDVLLSLNFANYVNHRLTGRRGVYRRNHPDVTLHDYLGDKMVAWIRDNLDGLTISFVGTGPRTDDMVVCTNQCCERDHDHDGHCGRHPADY